MRPAGGTAQAVESRPVSESLTDLINLSHGISTIEQHAPVTNASPVSIQPPPPNGGPDVRSGSALSSHNTAFHGGYFPKQDKILLRIEQNEQELIDGPSPPSATLNKNETNKLLNTAIKYSDTGATRENNAPPPESADLGDQLRRSSNRRLEYDSSSGELRRKLSEAIIEVPGSHGAQSFLPIPCISQLISANSVAQELATSNMSTQIRSPQSHFIQGSTRDIGCSSRLDKWEHLKQQTKNGAKDLWGGELRPFPSRRWEPALSQVPKDIRNISSA
ncbi:hypothetical protein FALCPG4_014681 [Fusarium falciforme]